jgi:photosystem I P700 chlorophyll a apoprotein A2
VTSLQCGPVLGQSLSLRHLSLSSWSLFSIYHSSLDSSNAYKSYPAQVLAVNSPQHPIFRNLEPDMWKRGVNSPQPPCFLKIEPGDFLVHHAISLGLHTTALILVKGTLDARGSRLMPDKKDFGYSFACDGPGRGGTCDISAWSELSRLIFQVGFILLRKNLCAQARSVFPTR